MTDYPSNKQLAYLGSAVSILRMIAERSVSADERDHFSETFEPLFEQARDLLGISEDEPSRGSHHVG